MDVASLGYRTDLAIRRAEGSQITDRGDHIVISTEQNPGYRWGNFFLLACPPRPGELPAWLARFAVRFPTATHRAFGLDVTDTADVGQEVFAEAGFSAERYVVLTASSVSQARQPGLTAVVRQLDGDDDWRQSGELRAACGGSGQTAEAAVSAAEQEFHARRLSARRRLAETGRAAWFGAFAGGRLVAQLGLVPVGDGGARYQDVETHPDFRRLGLAGTLVCRAGRHGLAEPGVSRLVMVADPGYPAIRLYESLGFSRTEDQVGFERITE